MKKVNLYLHLLVQILAQGAVASLVRGGAEKYYAAVVAIVGVTAAFFDNQNTSQTPPAQPLQ